MGTQIPAWKLHTRPGYINARVLTGLRKSFTWMYGFLRIRSGVEIVHFFDQAMS